jgi:hypothetical protein
MKSKCAIGLVVATCLSTIAPLAQATLTTFTDRTAWESSVIGGGLSVADADLASQVGDGITLNAGSPLSLPSGGLLAFNQQLEGRQVPNTWGTWSGGNTPRVLYSTLTTLNGTFTPGVLAFGFEAEPENYRDFSIKLELSDGSNLDQLVTGFGGASFFGWSSDDVRITAMKIQAASESGGFAIGRMVQGVPDAGGSLLLTLIGLGSVVWARRSMRLPGPRSL